MTYLLDTNACITIINRSASPAFAHALQTAIQQADELRVSSIGVHELWFGVAKSQRIKDNAHNLAQFLRDPFQVLEFDAKDARVSGEIRAGLARSGTPIGPYDTLIAGQALARGLTLVTANTREFSRFEGLSLVDWTI
jgi:tRNA(fMet)-specific endonuclease VapC